MSPSPIPQFPGREPLATLGKVLAWLLAASALLSLIQAFQLLAARPNATDIAVPGTAFGMRVGSVFAPGLWGSLVSSVGLGTGVVWLVWQYRAHSNLRARGIPGLRYTPGWAVGWWFVPGASLVMPYRTIRELWDNVDGLASATQSRRSHQPILRWWLVYLASGFVTLGAIGALLSTMISWVRSLSEAGPNQIPTLRFTAVVLRQIYLWTAIGDLVRVAAAGLAIVVVLDITKREEASGGNAGWVEHPTMAGVAPPRPDLGSPPG